MATSVERLVEAHLSVADLDASIAFYRGVVGLELAHVVPARQAAFFWIGSRASGMLGLWSVGSNPQKTMTHIAFATTLEQVIAAPRTLESAGIVALDFSGEPTRARRPWIRSSSTRGQCSGWMAVSISLWLAAAVLRSAAQRRSASLVSGNCWSP